MHCVLTIAVLASVFANAWWQHVSMTSIMYHVSQTSRAAEGILNDVLERPYTVGGSPPPSPDLPLLTAKSLLWRHFGPPSAGTIGGP